MDFKNMNLSFYIAKLGEEFEESHKEVKLQPVKNRQITMNDLPKKI